MKIADEVPSGIVHINEQTVGDEANAPFGGVAASGTGARSAARRRTSRPSRRASGSPCARRSPPTRSDTCRRTRQYRGHVRGVGELVIPTDHYLRFERVDEVRETERGIEASLHGERLQVDLVTDDVVRIRISRGGSFDERPTYAVCVDPTGQAGRAPGRARRRCRPAAHERPPAHPRARPVPHRRAPSRRVTGRRDRRRRRRPPVGLRDAERRVHGSPPVPPGGRGLRARREDRPAQPQGPRLHDVEPRRAEPGAECRVHGRARSGRPAIGQLQHGVRPVLRVDPALPPPRCPDLGRGLLVPRQRVPHALRLLPARGVPDPRRGRAVRRVRVRRAAAPRRPRGVHAPDREGRPAAVVVAGVPPVPLVRLHPGDRRGAGGGAPRTGRCPATPSGSTSTTWTAIASSRGTRRSSRTRPACWRGSTGRGSASSRSSTPASSTTPATGSTTRRSNGTCCAAPRAATTTSARSGRATRSFPTSSPRRPVPGGASSTRPMWPRAWPGSGTT